MSSTQTLKGFQVRIVEDFGTTVAKRIVNCCIGLIHQRGRIHVALTGGGTAREIYTALSRPDIREHLDVTAIDFYEGDERPVPPTHPDSNWGMAESLFLNPAGVPDENRHRMRGEAADLDEAAREYEALLCMKVPRQGGLSSFDLLLLGMGDDGHTASLFPGTAALTETRRLVVANEVPQHHTTRLTLTYPVLNAAQVVWVVACGAHKADAAHRAVEMRDPALPITHVLPKRGSMVWLLDRAAGSKLAPHTVINH